MDPNTVKITFKEPTGGWHVPFAGTNGSILPKHIMKEFVGAKSREAPLNTKLIGTGPYMVEDFKPGDLVIYKPNPNYRDAAKVGFGSIELKGGGDPTTAYFAGKVMKKNRDVSTADNVVRQNFDVSIDSEILEAPAS